MLLTLIIIIVATSLALLLGGSLEAIARTRFRYVWLLFAGLGIQLVFSYWSPTFIGDRAGLAILLVSNAAVALFLALNARLPGLVIASTGLLLNVAVIFSNGAMPVSASAARASGVTAKHFSIGGIKHERMTDNTLLPWIGDVIPIPGVEEVASIGDVVLALGIGRLIFVRARTRDEETGSGHEEGRPTGLVRRD